MTHHPHTWKEGFFVRVICILCDQAYEPNKKQLKKLTKYPHLIQICQDCAERITKQTTLRKSLNQSAND